MRLSEELRGRTKRYASAVVRLYANMPRARQEVAALAHQLLRSPTSCCARPPVAALAHQLLRSGTSVAAHAREASRARSDAEFCSKLDGLLQEADESQLWIELLRDDCGLRDEKLDWLFAETGELLAIFTTIVSKLRRRGN